MDTRFRESSDARNEHAIFYRLLLIAMVAVIVSFLFEDKQGFVMNAVTEVGGVALTFYVLDWWIRRRDEEHRKEEQKRELISELTSSNNDIAKHAAEKLRFRDWLTDGSLQHVDLLGADLTEANLNQADLSGANLSGASLPKAYFHQANLQGAIGWRLHPSSGFDISGIDLSSLRNIPDSIKSLLPVIAITTDLREAQMQWANLRNVNFERVPLRDASLAHADLREANLWSADLENAHLLMTKLQGADMIQANLRGLRDINYAEFDENTILPDGSKWTLDTDMRRFTDPGHIDKQGNPDFWQPEWVKDE